MELGVCTLLGKYSFSFSCCCYTILGACFNRLIHVIPDTMDGVSIAASIVGIAGAGIQISIKLVTLATQISTASERVSSIGNDISLTAGVLHQLGDLMTQKTTKDGISIFNKGGLETTRSSAATCERIFLEVEKEVKRASEQLRGCKRIEAGKVKLSKVEKAKWPFLQPSVDILRADLRDAKGTLMLMLQVTSLAFCKRIADISNHTPSTHLSEQRDFVSAIVSIQQQQQQDQRKLIEGNGRLRRSRGSSTDKILTTYREEQASTFSSPLPQKNPSFTHNSPQPSGPPARVKPHRNTVHTGPLQPTALPTYSEANDPRDIDLISNADVSIAAGPMPGLPGLNRVMPWPRESDRPSSPARKPPINANCRRPDDEMGKQLHLFLIKPIAKDYFDKIELTWSLYNTKMQQLAIKNYIAGHKKYVTSQSLHSLVIAISRFVRHSFGGQSCEFVFRISPRHVLLFHRLVLEKHY